MNVFAKRMFFSVCATAVAVFGLSVTALAATVATSDGNGADTYLSNDDNSGPDIVHGGEESFAVRSLVTITTGGPPDFEEIVSGVRARVGMLRFDLTAPDAPTTDVRLQVMETFGTRDRQLLVYGLNDGPDDLWDEGATSYSNAPGVDASAANGTYAMDPSQTTLLGTLDVFNIQSEGPRLLTSSPTDLPLDGFLADDTNGLVTLFLAFDTLNTDSNPDWAFASKENTGGFISPRLTDIPEPSSLVLSSLAAFGLMLRRRA